MQQTSLKIRPETTVGELVDSHPRFLLSLNRVVPKSDTFCGIRKDDTLREVAERRDEALEVLMDRLRSVDESR